MKILDRINEDSLGVELQQIDLIQACIAECLSCASVCLNCVDACLKRSDINGSACIKANLMCARVCETTAHILSLENKVNDMVQTLLEACIKMCDVCRERCAEHKQVVNECALCSDACLNSIRTLRNLLEHQSK